MADEKKTDKKRDTLRMKGSGEDGLPTDAELDALQAQIDEATQGMAEREAEAEVKPEQRIEQLETELLPRKHTVLNALPWISYLCPTTCRALS